MLNTQMNKDTSLFATIVKIDDEQRMVWGYASTGKRDSQGEIVMPDAVRTALPNYMEFANIREMHKSWAVGVTKEAGVDEKGLFIGVKVVDDPAWLKVKEKVYKGFSIGGKVTARNETDPTIIEGLDLCEISLVDRPANPEALFDLVKNHVEPEEPVEEVKEVPVVEAPVVEPPEEKKEEAKTEVVAVADDAIGLAMVGEIFKHYKIELPVVVATREDVLKEDGETSTALPDAILSIMDLVAKVGARNSAADIKSLQAIHDHSAAMGATCATDKVSNIQPGDLAKSEAARSETQDKLTKAESDIESLNKRVKELEAMPVAPKGSIRAVSKEKDAGTSSSDPSLEEQLAKMTPEERTRTLLKTIHAAGGQSLLRRPVAAQ